MKAHMSTTGVLTISPEDPMEAAALHLWNAQFPQADQYGKQVRDVSHLIIETTLPDQTAPVQGL